MQRQRKIALRDSLLSRYAESLGQMTMRKRHEQAVRAAHAESELANRTKSAFLATMSHELRTPLNSIIGFSDVIVTLKDPKASEYAAHIAKSGRRLLEVVSDILDISRLESGGFVLNRQPADLADIVQDAVEVLRDAIAEKSQDLDLRLPRELPTLAVDAKRIKQVLVNLLSNASKFTPARGRIILLARRNPDGGATVAVADTGAGMSPEQIATALKPFGQVQGHLARNAEGTGLGLPIARGLAQQHGGDIMIESEVGRGTTAILTLPPDRSSVS